MPRAIKVKFHGRRSKRGVATPVSPHIRWIRSRPFGIRFFNIKDSRDRKMAQQMFEWGNSPRNTNMVVDINDPRMIVLTYPKTLTPREVATVLSHETLHGTLADIGEPKASFYLDTRKSGRGANGQTVSQRLTREGLYRYSLPKNPTDRILRAHGIHDPRDWGTR